MKETFLSINEINPFIRHGSCFTLLPKNIGKKVGYDNRLLYVCKGSLKAIINDNIYNVMPGTMLIWKPGLVYELIFDTDNPPLVIVLNFDYTRSRTDLTSFLPFPPPSQFKPIMITEICSFTDCEVMNSPVFLQNMQDEEDGLMTIVNEYTLKKPNYILTVRGMFLAILGKAARLASSANSTNELNTKVEMITEYIHSNYNQPIKNSDISRRFSFHPVYINRLMVKYTGTSLHQYLMNYRIRRALHLLHTTSKTITEISQETGFETMNYFSSVFKKTFGLSPSKYLQNNIKKF